VKTCPSCHEEFLEEITECTDCKLPLVHSADFKPRTKGSDLLSKEELFESEMLPFSEGPLAQCREIEKVLARAKVSCAVYPVNMSSSGTETLGTTSDMKYAVLIREADLDAARTAMEGKFHADVAKEGRGQVMVDAIDLEQSEITCPACGHVGPLKDGECSVCELHLGV
jgi:hypothetical protein